VRLGDGRHPHGRAWRELWGLVIDGFHFVWGSGDRGDSSGKQVTQSLGAAPLLPARSGAEAAAPAQVRKTPSWPRNWANFSLLQLYSHRHGWPNLHLSANLTPFSLQARRGASTALHQAVATASISKVQRLLTSSPATLNAGDKRCYKRPRSIHSCTALYVYLVILHRKCTGARDNNFTGSQGRRFHSTLSLAVIDCHSLGIYRLILLSLLSLSLKMTVSPLTIGILWRYECIGI
jgi:hypothetical protein